MDHRVLDFRQFMYKIFSIIQNHFQTKLYQHQLFAMIKYQMLPITLKNEPFIFNPIIHFVELIRAL